MSKSITTIRLTCVLGALATALTATTGCDRQEPIQPSQPAARAPNRTPEPIAPTTNPAAAPLEDASRVEMGTRRSTVAPTASPTASATPSAAPTEMVMPRPPQSDPSTDPALATFAGLTAPKPVTWQYRVPAATSTMRVAEYSVPGVVGSDQAQIIVYQFSGGGTVDDNIKRWKDQVKNADGTPAEQKIETIQAGDLSITVSEATGAYRGMGMPEAKNEYTLIASMVQTDGSPVFVYLSGPAKTVEANRESFMSLLRGLKRSDPMK